MSIRAEIDGLSLSDLLQVLSTGRLTGVADINRGPDTAKLVLKHGRIVHAQASTQPRLGERLIASGFVTQEQLDAALKEHMASGSRRPLGSVLVESGILPEEVLETELRNHIHFVVSDLITWRSGVVRFNSCLLDDDLLLLQKGVNTGRVLIHASVTADGEEEVDESIPETDEGTKLEMLQLPL